ncbi:hypothetical protein CC78DRAFT_576014 [Lojkania enalia]|uniref:Uncharacterized protein n=1 Tax=Lojkania enalia TaxID=147567 RepID=A0A9P4KH12_9PLEO|nr:hypothetical protein CC78DRAFT_576014 [Didymosphaeria enalia]
MFLCSDEGVGGRATAGEVRTVFPPGIKPRAYASCPYQAERWVTSSPSLNALAAARAEAVRTLFYSCDDSIQRLIGNAGSVWKQVTGVLTVVQDDKIADPSLRLFTMAMHSIVPGLRPWCLAHRCQQLNVLATRQTRAFLTIPQSEIYVQSNVRVRPTDRRRDSQETHVNPSEGLVETLNAFFIDESDAAGPGSAG